MHVGGVVVHGGRQLRVHVRVVRHGLSVHAAPRRRAVVRVAGQAPLAGAAQRAVLAALAAAGVVGRPLVLLLALERRGQRRAQRGGRAQRAVV